MNAKAAASIAVKVLAIFTFIKFVTYLQSVYGFIDMVKHQPSNISVGLRVVSMIYPILLLLVVSIFLWLYSDKLSDHMVKNLAVNEETKISYEDLQIVAFSVVGLFLVVNSLPELINAAINMKMLESQRMMQPMNMRMTQLVGTGLKVLIGFWLLVGSQGIVGLIRTLRTAGLKNEDG